VVLGEQAIDPIRQCLIRCALRGDSQGARRVFDSFASARTPVLSVPHIQLLK